MKKLILLVVVTVFCTTDVFSQTLAPADACPGSNTPTINSGSFTINITGTATGYPLAIDATMTANDEAVCGLKVKEYIGGVEVSCNGSSNGEITAYVTGGNYPYRYTLYLSTTSATSGFAQASQVIVNTTNHVFNGLAGDAWYYVTIEQTNGTTGNFGCLVTTMGTGTCQGAVYLDQPEVVTATYCQAPDYCQNGSAAVTINISGGVQYYNVTWSSGTALITGIGAASAGAADVDLDGTASGAQLGTNHASTQNPSGNTYPDVVEGNSDDGNTTQTVPQTVTISGLTGNYPYTFNISDANGCVVQ